MSEAVIVTCTATTFEHVVAFGPRDAESRARASSAASIAGKVRSAVVGPTTLGPKHSATQ